MSQQMKLAPRMIQSMEILQLNSLALLEKIDAELNSNPILEIADSEAGPETVSQENAPAEDIHQQELTIGDGADNAEDFQRLDGFDSDFSDHLYRGDSITNRRYDDEYDPKLAALNNAPVTVHSLHEYLTNQWQLVDAEESIKKAGQEIIDYIDDRGYLQVRLEQLYNKDKSDFNLEHLAAALKLVQQLEPLGVGAGDLKECLLIQMAQSADDMSFEMKLISKYMDKLLENQLPYIAKKMNCSLERINQALERMRKFDTSPGLVIGKEQNHPVAADVIVEPNEDGSYSVFLAETSLPSLRINQLYAGMVRDRNVDEKTRLFVRNNLRSAHWFIDAIEQRKQTLLRVSRAIVKYQSEFFEKGPLYLKPLPMSRIADDVGIHLATVSRAVSGKYVQSPQGLAPLRSFFVSGIETTDGQSQSVDAIRINLQSIIDAEDKSAPLTDDEIKNKLEEMGLKKLARRTVTKYRKLLNIPTARFRKKY